MKREFFYIVLSAAVIIGLCACAQKAEEAPEAPADVPAEAVPAWLEQFDLGVRYLSEGNYEEAIIAFTAVIDIDPKNAGALSGRGQAYVLSGETEENLAAALADFEAALAADETLAEAWLGLADVYIRQGDYDKAMEVLKEALEKTGNAPSVADKLAEMESGNISDSSGRFRQIRYFNTDGILTNYETFDYNEQGELSTHVDYLADGSEIWRTEYEYNESGKCIREKEAWRDPDYTRIEITEYTYDENGNAIRSDTYDENGNLQSYRIVEHDSDGKIVKQTSFRADGTMTRMSVFEYDENGNNTKLTYFRADGTITSMLVFEYDENGKQTGQYTYDGNGNLEAYYRYLYNDAGERIGSEHYDAEGNLIGTSVAG